MTSEALLWALIALAMLLAAGAGFVVAWLAFEWRARGFYLIRRPRLVRRPERFYPHLVNKAPSIEGDRGDAA